MSVRLADFTWQQVVFPRHEVTPEPRIATEKNEAAEEDDEPERWPEQKDLAPRTTKGSKTAADMEHRHFNLVADAIRTAPVDEDQREALAKHFSGYLSRTNPRFSHERFMGAATGKHLTGRDKVR